MKEKNQVGLETESENSPAIVRLRRVGMLEGAAKRKWKKRGWRGEGEEGRKEGRKEGVKLWGSLFFVGGSERKPRLAPRAAFSNGNAHGGLVLSCPSVRQPRKPVVWRGSLSSVA